MRRRGLVSWKQNGIGKRKGIARRSLRFEAMESRRLLAVMVDTFSDVVDPNDGITSLREAIAEAGANIGADRVELQPGHYPLSSQLNIDDTSGPLEIVASGGKATIDGLGAMRVFRVYPGSDVTFEGLEITGGDSSSGSGVYSQGILALRDTDVVNNWATFGGGGLLVQGSLTVEGGRFSDNTTGGIGGAIYARDGSVVRIDNARLENNAADKGGALFSRSGSVVAIEDSQLLTNTSTDGGAGIYVEGAQLSIQDTVLADSHSGAGGGAIYATLDSTTEIKGSEFTGNSAPWVGGAIFNFRSELAIENSLFAQNEVHNGSGGALVITNDSTATITNSIFAENAAPSYGGAVYPNSSNLTIADTVFTGNAAGERGGALYAVGATLSVGDSVVSNNESGGVGGGFHLTQDTEAIISHTDFSSNRSRLAGGAINAFRSHLEVNDSTFAGNQASAGHGGALQLLENTYAEIVDSYFKENEASNRGGAVYSVASRLILDHTELENNLAADTGGVLYAAKSKVEIIDSLLAENVGTNAGGAIYATQSSTTRIARTTIKENQAKFTGGAIFNFSSSLTIEQSEIVENEATVGEGGAISSLGSSTVLIHGTLIAENHSAFRGGAIANRGSILWIEGSVLRENTAAELGGAIYSESNLKVVASELNENVAGMYGGAIYIKSGFVDIQSSSLIENAVDAPDSWGTALFVDVGSTLQLDAFTVVVGDAVVIYYAT